MRAYQASSPKSPLKPVQIDRPALGPSDVEIAVTCCALCHSDLHLWQGDWQAPFPLTPGHEIAGRITQLGSQVTTFKIGDRVGLGWQCGACMACRECRQGQPHLCQQGKRRTCVGRAGGLAERVAADHRFVYALPAGLGDAEAAPLLCAGLTVYAPLARFGVKSGQHIAVVGFGGLGHLAVQFARAMGATVDAFDPDLDKTPDAIACGASALIDARAELALTALKDHYDMILVTTPANLNWNTWLSMLRIGGTLCLAGVPSKALAVDPDHLLDGQKILTGSVIGSPADMRSMLAFAAKHSVKPLVETMPFDAANTALERLLAGKARYRVVLTGE